MVACQARGEALSVRLVGDEGSFFSIDVRAIDGGLQSA